MLDFFIGKIVRQNAQKYIDRLEPDVGVHIPEDLPLPSVKIIKTMCVLASKVNGFEDDIKKLSDDELKAKTDEFRGKYQQGVKDAKDDLSKLETEYKTLKSYEEKDRQVVLIEKAEAVLKKKKQSVLGEILPEAFAVVREAGIRVLGMRHYDIQLVGGMMLHKGMIAEMATGEGKTLVATLPSYINAITGDGVHVVTVNDYLAKRDSEWMGPLHEFLGLTVGVILHDMTPSERQEAYACDITYGTNNEFGFDYLRDNMVSFKEDMVQRQHHYAIVDEVDSILVDEARTPLIISGPADEATDKYYRANDVAKKLKGRRITEGEEIDAKYREEDLTVGFDYVSDEKNRSVSLTEQGELKAAKEFGIENLHDMETMEYRHHILQALKAKEFFKRDVDYVVRDGEVIIVDEFTGRMMPGRRWSDGLHQAVEAREEIKIERENQTLATVTFQNYFRMYEKLSGMTGTAYTEATEFEQIYKLECVVMPTNRVLKRKSYTDCIYKSHSEKFDAVVAEIEEYHDRGQPVLVGTISIEKSELLSSMLKQKGIPHQVLNAKYHELEAQIVSQAGRLGAVTIATNMAGRGTDIVLGGNAEFLAKQLVDEKEGENADGSQKEEVTEKFLEQFREQVKMEHEKVVAAGGLHVLATERHESRRIDNQLRGRSGRQGDPGSSRFFVSLEDDLMRLFASERIMMMMDKMGMEDGQVIEHPWVARALEVAQKRVETYNFEIRKQLIEYDNVMNKQREAIYGLRRSILKADNVKDRVVEAIESEVSFMAEQFLYGGNEEVEWDIDGLGANLWNKFHFDLSPHKETLREKNLDEIKELISGEVLALYNKKEQEFSAESFRAMEKFILLNTIDSKWKDHLYAMDHLKSGVGLRAYGQRDPLLEYKKEGFEMFQMMFDTINQEVAEMVFKARPVSDGPVHKKSIFDSVPQEFVHKDFSGLSQATRSQSPGEGVGSQVEEPPKATPIRKAGPKVGRNDPCSCGSGKKYKKCCGS